MKIELIRHGDTAMMARHQYQGRTDVPLTEEGKAKLQASDTVPETVYVSPMIRARETAEAIFPSAEQIFVPDFREMDFGDFEGRSADDMAEDADYRAWVDGWCMGQCPNGESTESFIDRVCGAFAALLDERFAAGEPADLVIVAHGGTAMAVMERFADAKRPFHEWHLKSGCGYLADAGEWKEKRRLKLLCETDHNLMPGSKGQDLDCACARINS